MNMIMNKQMTLAKANENVADMYPRLKPWVRLVVEKKSR